MKSQVEVAQEHIEMLAAALHEKEAELVEAAAFMEDSQAEIQALKNFLMAKSKSM